MRQRDLGRAWRRGLAALATLVVAIAAAPAPAPMPEGGGGLALRLRSRVEAPDAGGLFRVVERPVSWEPRETAIIVCDMWDSHHCLNAVRRVKEMGPTMDRVLRAARGRGALIIHAPSDCMAAYKDHPARKRALETPRAKDLPRDIAQWCRVIPSEEKGKYPIDQADGGEDDDPAEHKRWADELSAMGRNPRLPWRAQTDLLAIDAEADVISDKGEEVWSVLEHRGIKNVILLGVHLNMCVLGRPFGLRQLAKNGKNVALMRDMTDTMYNPARSPHVSHFAGTDLMVEHVEKFVCPTLTSDQLLGGLPFRFHGDARPHAALILDEDEYRTEATVPEFASTHLTKDYFVSFVLGDPRNRDDLLGVGILDAADLALVSVRRRVLPRGQLEAVRKFVASGKPVVGIRTASHAFAPRGNEPVPEGRAAWTGFDAEVLGGNYHGHLGVGPKTTIREAPGAASHPILKGVDPAKLTGHGSLYKVSPLAKSTTPLLLGTVPGQPAEPIAWVNAPTSGNRVFTTSLGHIDDFKDPEFARLLKNAIDWAARPAPSPAQAPAAEKAGAGAVPGSRDGKRGPLGPRESLRTFAVPDDLEVELVLSEPEITQPVFLNFDERGRMWVVEYRQYPEPAGLTILSRDKYWRAVYDKVPQAPPHHVRGRDRITIHEDSDGDGTFDRHSTFVDGLNIATACARGRGGVWVLNPPFLLFYPDRNDDDVPDGDPVVHLSGFGLEDTHSVVNSLRWGPDGWLYAAQGSTVTGDVVRPGLDRTPRHTLGQLIWRYHPESRRYEVFAEGGGNAFGVEIDAKGRVYSGHNGGDTRGFHYVQGGYYRKGFEKHGALSNPYAFGYFPSMTHPKAQRFSHTFLIDDDRALPGPYRGRLFAVEPLLSRVVFSAIEPEGSTFRTHDLGFAVSSRDPWFRPVDIKVGPEGAIYIADWYDGHLSHLLNREGQLDRDNGRIYRLKAKGARPSHAPDLARATSEELVGVLGSGGPWARQSALRLLGDRKDATVVARLRRMALEGQGQAALEGLWALNLCGGLDEPSALAALDHADPYVRSWTVRLLGDEGKVSPAVASKLEELARIERNVEVRSQLACSAKRLPAGPGLAIVAKLLAHDEDVKDPHLPLLLWWAIEARCEDHRDAVLALFRDPAAWRGSMVDAQVLPRLMQRFAASGSRRDLLTCAELLRMAPGRPEASRLMQGFEQALKGRTLAAPPEELAAALDKVGGGSPLLDLRRGRAQAVEEALRVVGDEAKGADRARRLAYVEVFGEVRQPRCVPLLLAIVGRSTDDELRVAALKALRTYDDPAIAAALIARYAAFPDDVRAAAQALLVSRPGSAFTLLGAIDRGEIDPATLPPEVVRTLTVHRDPRIASSVARHWGTVEGAASAELQREIERLAQVASSGNGDRSRGKRLFDNTCARCHTLFGQGGKVGPDLTAYQRLDVTNLLLSLVNPDAEIREGYETVQVATRDGRVASGLLVDQDPQVLVIRGSDGQAITFRKDEVEELQPLRRSLMPEGLLKGLDDQQVRDLLGYLRSSQPLNE